LPSARCSDDTRVLSITAFRVVKRDLDRFCVILNRLITYGLPDLRCDCAVCWQVTRRGRAARASLPQPDSTDSAVMVKRNSQLQIGLKPYVGLPDQIFNFRISFRDFEVQFVRSGPRYCIAMGKEGLVEVLKRSP